MAGFEHPSELRRARIHGPADQRGLLLGWEPIHPKALLAPPGAIAQLAPERPVETLGGADFDASEYRVAYLRLVGPDGQFLDAYSEGRKVIPEDWLNCVEFRRAGALNGPDPEAGLDTLFQDKLEDPEGLHARLAQLEASGLIRRIDEPAALDPALRPIFWRYFGHRARLRQLDARLSALSLAGVDLVELVDLVATVRTQAFRDGTAIGAAMQAHGLQRHLGLEIAQVRSVKGRQRMSAELTNADAKRVALRAEQELYRAWQKHKRAIKRDFNKADDHAAELLRRAPPDPDGSQVPSVWTVVKMIRWWKRGHDPVVTKRSWRELQDGKAKL